MFTSPSAADKNYASPAGRNGRLAPTMALKKRAWTKGKTLAEEIGGSDDHGAAAVGLVGNVPVVFQQGEEKRETMAIAGQPISEVAMQADQYIKYKCKKGECGTCEVKVNGQWVRACVTNVPNVPEGESYVVDVRESWVKPKGKSARFYSLKSIYSGMKNNVLGMVGFVRGAKKDAGGNYNERIAREKELEAMVAARRAARAQQQK